jgi:hypothetical protein
MVERDAELRPSAVVTIRRPSVRWRRRWTLVGAAAVAVTVLSGGLALAGSLPAPAQDAVSKTLDRVGITVPSASHSIDREHPASTGQEISTIATTTEATGVAKGAEISAAASGGVSHAGEHGSATAREHGAAAEAHRKNGHDIAADRSGGHGAPGS